MKSCPTRVVGHADSVGFLFQAMGLGIKEITWDPELVDASPLEVVNDFKPILSIFLRFASATSTAAATIMSRLVIHIALLHVSYPSLRFRRCCHQIWDTRVRQLR